MIAERFVDWVCSAGLHVLMKLAGHRNSCKKMGFIVKVFLDEFGMLLSAFVYDFRLSSVSIE